MTKRTHNGIFFGFFFFFWKVAVLTCGAFLPIANGIFHGIFFFFFFEKQTIDQRFSNGMNRRRKKQCKKHQVYMRACLHVPKWCVRKYVPEKKNHCHRSEYQPQWRDMSMFFFCRHNVQPGGYRLPTACWSCTILAEIWWSGFFLLFGWWTSARHQDVQSVLLFWRSGTSGCTRARQSPND